MQGYVSRRTTPSKYRLIHTRGSEKAKYGAFIVIGGVRLIADGRTKYDLHCMKLQR